MKKITLSIVCICWFAGGFGQHIHYQKTFEAALTQAAKSNKLLLLTLSLPAIPNHPIPEFAITNPEIVKLYNKNFINYSLNYNDSAAVPLIKKYKTTVYPTYLFIDSLGNLVYKETSGSTSTSKYFGMSDKALAAQISGRTLTDYMALYNNDKNNATFLKDYITLKEELGYDDNAELADQYANLLPTSSFLDYQTVLFIMAAGPYAYGKTYNLCHLNKKITDSIYKYEPLALRTLINNRIITNTMNKAIAHKDITIAQQAARYTAATWALSNPKKGASASASRMLGYYLAVNDTASYLKQASFFYPNYYMNISADSAAKIDKEEYARTRNTAFRYPLNLGDRIIDNAVQISNAAPHRVANILNSGAYSFYILGTHNQTYLVNALLWSKRAIELYPSYHNYDTLAHLLYRLGLFEEAIYTQDMAVKLAVKSKAFTNEIKHLKTEQHKIKKHLL